MHPVPVEAAVAPVATPLRGLRQRIAVVGWWSTELPRQRTGRLDLTGTFTRLPARHSAPLGVLGSHLAHPPL